MVVLLALVFCKTGVSFAIDGLGRDAAALVCEYIGGLPAVVGNNGVFSYIWLCRLPGLDDHNHSYLEREQVRLVGTQTEYHALQALPQQRFPGRERR